MTPDQATILAAAKANPDMLTSGNADIAALRAASGLAPTAFDAAVRGMIEQGWATRYSLLTGPRLAITWTGYQVAEAGESNG